MIVSAVFRTVPSSLTFRSSRALIRRRCMYPDRGVHEAFPSAHRVEEVFRRVETALVRRLHEALRLRAEIALLEMRERAVPVAAAQALPADRLLPDRSGHLGEIEHRPPSAGSGHDHRAVLDAQVLARDLAGLVSRAAEDLHRLDLERLLEGPTGHLLELAPFVRLHEVLHLLDRGPEDVRNLLLRFFRDVLVVDAGREASDHDRADGHRRRPSDEVPRGVRPVVPSQLVQDLALERADRVLVDRTGQDYAVLDDDERVFLFELL